MSLIQSPNSFSQIHPYVCMSLALAEFTRFPGNLPGIPTYLSQRLRIPRVSLALVRQHNDFATPEVVHQSSSEDLGHDQLLKDAILMIHNQAGSLLGMSFDSDLDDLTGCCSMEFMLPGMAPHPRTIAFVQQVPPIHLMLLLVHQSVEDDLLSESMTETLVILSKELAEQLRPLLKWQASPSSLESPFDQLSDREWPILWELNTGMCEKQIARKLEMSPHTLHSHIKSIYRKVGVQGRLSLIEALNLAVSRGRVKALDTYCSADSCR